MGGHENQVAHGHGHDSKAAHGHGHHVEAHGHGHDHHHHHGPNISKSVIHYDIPEPPHPCSEFKAPDWKFFKVENAPELVKVQNRLAALGLKDPWLRLNIIFLTFFFLLLFIF